jgi:hypothetical protein
MSGFEPLVAGGAEAALAEAALFDASAGLTAGAAGAGTAAGIGSLIGALGDGTAMGMIPSALPEAAATIPGLSAYTPTLQAVAPEAFAQGMNAVQASGTPNFASMMSGPAIDVAGGAATDASALNTLDLAEGANYGGSGFSDYPLSDASAYQAVGQPTTMAEMAQAANKYGPVGANAAPGGIGSLADIYNAVPKELKYAGAGYSALQMLNADKNKYNTPAQEKYSGPLSKFKYDPKQYVPTTTPQPTPYTPVRYAYAEGGIASLGGYSDGGRMLKGPGDGMSDSIPATISNKQPARLADGEFVVPADVVSHLGNGSTDAGAKQLYKMMDKVRVARTGKKMQGRQINPRKYVPA